MKNAYRFIACIFIAFLACSIVINLAMGDSAYSESEKRELTQLPEFNTQNVLSGKFTSEFDKYTSDQFFARDSWVRVKGMSQYLMGQRLLNGVYVTENRYMRKLMTDEKRLSDNIDAILKLSEKSDVPVTLLIAPEAVSVYQDELPRFASAGEHEKVIAMIRERLGDKVKVIYPKDELRAHRNEYIYFRGDHHWTMRGALYAYNELLRSQGKDALKMPEFQTVAGEFRGSMLIKAGAELPWIAKDEIEVPVSITNNDFAVVVNRGGKDEDGVMFDAEHLSGEDKYRYFQGGDQPLMAISSLSGEGSALVMKDSFCNVLLPYLATDYKTTYVADVRYNRTSPAEYARSMGVDEIILVYGMDSLCNEYALSILGK